MNRHSAPRPIARRLLVPALAIALAHGAHAFLLETDDLRLDLGEDAMLRSLVAKHDGTEYAAPATPRPVAAIYSGGQSVPTGQGQHAAVLGRWTYRGGTRTDATRLEQRGDRVTLEFGDAHVRATYRVRATATRIAFEPVSIEGATPDRIEFPRLDVRPLPKLGHWVNLAADERFGLCLCGLTLGTDIAMEPEPGRVRLTAAAEAAVGFPGAASALFGCRDPDRTFLGAMEKIEREFGLPQGAAARRSPIQRLSYLWASRPTPANIDSYIRLARRGGFRMLLFSYGAFSKGAGHFEWNARYPNGMADLKRVTDAIRAAGLKIGLHIHYSKADRTDRYVTPKPDPRLHAARRFTLARDVAADAVTLPVREDPAGCTLDTDRRLLRLGTELIEYAGFTDRPPFAFTGCRRGHRDTVPAPHAAGAALALLDVDTWPRFIRFDQDTDIQDEVARRLADIYRRTGPYDMIYFDGAEDVHEPFWYHTASAQHRVFRLLDPPPPVCESAHYTHFSWHMISRANAYDTIAPPDGMKDFCRLMPCPTAAARVMDHSRIDFGWLGRFGGTKSVCPGPDVFEYVASRAAAWDCPISLHAPLQDIQANPRADDCLEAIKTWEDARLAGRITEADRRRLRNVAPGDERYVPCYEQRTVYDNLRAATGLTDSQRRLLADRREHHLFVNERARHELVEIEEAPQVAGGAVKAFLFRREGRPGDAYVLAWATRGELRLRIPTGTAVAMRPFATRIPCASTDGVTEITLGRRTYILLPDTSPDRARELISQAEATH